ncbi:MAG: DUF3592 domain-containing protein [Planctomycetes bacterium]|nr:DUF3592 domain-containing protein [Planctomycetota bacterium]
MVGIEPVGLNIGRKSSAGGSSGNPWFLLIFVVVGAGLAVYGNSVVAKAKASAGWPSAKGRIERSSLDSRRTRSTDSRGHGRETTSYYADIMYSYTVDGRKYSGGKVRYGASSTSRAAADKLVEKYRAGEDVDVYYDPAKPEESVLEPGAVWQSYLMLGIGILLAIGGLLLFVWAMRGGGKARQQQGQHREQDVGSEAGTES